MLISKHFDPVIGIDIHILVIPPAGPVPIPHPHISLVFDVIDYVPILGATVKVGGIPRSTAGSAGRPIPHIPMGGPFSKPPMNEDEIFMGSTTVLADGGPLSFTALPTLSCHDIGAIAPPRKKKPKKSFGMVLPTSMVMSIPLGRPVMVGGPPTIDMMGLLMAGGFAALGAAFKKLRKVQKKSKRAKKISDAIHSRAKKAMDKLGVPPNVRNKVHKGICTVTGHPVDVATGKMFTDHIDFSLPGPLPLVWERTWYSTSVYDGVLGHGWHHNYDVKLCEINNAVAVRMADGRGVAFPALDINETSFNRQERMTLFRDEEGYALDTSDRKRYRFTPFNGDKENQLLTSLSQTTSGAAIRFFYNEKAQLHQIIDSGNRQIHITYTDEGRIHQIYLPEPESNVTRDHTKPTFFCAVEHHYRHGMLVQVNDALQQPLQYHYDGTLLIKETFRSGLSFYFEYDGRDHNARCLRTWGDEGIYYRDIRYDIENNITWVKDSLGNVITYYHDGILPYKIMDPLQNISKTSYNSFFQIICNTDQLGNNTYYEYNDFGNVIKITNADGSSRQQIFDNNHNLIASIDPLGNTWRYEYNSHNRISAVIDPLQHKTCYEYDGALLIQVINATKNSFQFYYDQNLNLRRVTEASQNELLQEFDALGNVIASIDSRGNRRNVKRDKLNRIIQVNDPDGNQRNITYDAANNIIHLTDQQYDIQFTYAGIGRLVTRSQNGTTVKFTYNTEEQLIAIVNQSGRAYEFELDPNGDISSESGFDGLTRQYQRDACRRVTEINRPGHNYSLITYNSIGRPLRISHSDGSHESFMYSADGALIEASNANSIVKFERNPLGLITKEIQGKFWIASTYNALGLRTRVQSSRGLDQVIERNERGDTTKVTTGDNHFSAVLQRDTQGFEIQRSLPGGIQSRWIRDKLGRPVQQDINKEQRKLSEKTYIWGANDRLVKIIDSLHENAIFTHDSFGNLISANYNDNHFEMRVPDSIGNIFKTFTQQDREYGPAGQLLAIHTDRGAIRYQYDAEGNLESKIEADGKKWMYEWNGCGMLKKVIRPDGDEITFQYDAFGRRFSKTYRNKVTFWAWDGDNPIHEWQRILQPTNIQFNISQQNSVAMEINASHRYAILQSISSQGPPEAAQNDENKITWLFDPDSWAPMAKMVGDQCYSIITNYLGTPVKIFDRNGDEVWAADVSIWGELRNLYGDKDFCPFRWPGQYEDEETGLYYNRFRYYDPIAGQFISQDPIGLRGGLKAYCYTRDPLTWIDPFGLSNIVYRALNPADVAALNAGQPISARNPTASASPMDHVLKGSDVDYPGDQYISVTKDRKLAEIWARKSGTEVVEIDLDKITAPVLDLSTGSGRTQHFGEGISSALEGSDLFRANKFAKGAKEMLVEGEIPNNAVVRRYCPS